MSKPIRSKKPEALDDLAKAILTKYKRAFKVLASY